MMTKVMKLSVVAASLLLAAPAFAETSASVVDVSGTVTITKTDGTSKKARIGMKLRPGTKLKTGDNSTVELKLSDGSVLRMRPGTSMALSGVKRKKKKNSVLLFFGRLWSKVASSDGDKSYQINGATAVAGVRGTEFETAVADDGTMRVYVTEGEVGVDDGNKTEGVKAGREIQADEGGVGAVAAAKEAPQWNEWEESRQKRLGKNGRVLVDSMRGRIMTRKQRMEKLRAKQRDLEERRKRAEARAKRGQPGALDEVRGYNKELSDIADQIADLGDEASTQFGMVDRYADLANDPRFRMVDRKYLKSQAKSLRAVQKSLDKLVKEGTDISYEAMDKMMDEMGSGKRGTLKEDRGSTKQLFDGKMPGKGGMDDLENEFR